MSDELNDAEVEDTVTVPEPAPVEPAPVEPVVDPVPEPQPEPQPEPPAPAPEPQPAPEAPKAVDGLEEFGGEVLDKMAAHLRKREKLAISLDDAAWQILTDPVTNAQYKKLKELGKF